MWIAYLIVLHALALIGLGTVCVLAYLWVLANWTNPLTGRWLPWVVRLFPFLEDKD